MNNKIINNNSGLNQKNIFSHVETLVIGGGIVGAGIFRDLALHGHRVMLIDKSDWCAETSSKSSKMLHGGIRYLENFEFHLVYEALHEKNLWLKLAPHLCFDSEFLIPIFKDALRPLWMIRSGLLLYDVLSGFSNTPHEVFNAKETLKALPGLKSKGLKGSGVYHDAIVDDAKLGLEVIYDGLLHKNAQALSHVEVLALEESGKFYKVHLIDLLTNERRTIFANQVAVALGPFTDIFMSKVLGNEWSPCLIPNKGSHIWFKKSALPINSSLVIQDKKGRIIFVIPQGEKILVGTTEVLAELPYENMQPTTDETKYLINLLSDYFPEANFGADQIISTYAGVRPLVKDDLSSNNLSKVAREHKIFFPRENLSVIVGGKYTTFRKMAEDISSWALHKNNSPHLSNLTKAPLGQKSLILPWTKNILNREVIKKIIHDERPRTFADLLIRRIGAANESELKLLYPDGPSIEELYSWCQK